MGKADIALIGCILYVAVIGFFVKQGNWKAVALWVVLFALSILAFVSGIVPESIP